MSHSIRWLSIANLISGGKDVLWYPCRSHHVSAPRVMDPVGATTRKFLPLLTWAALIQSIKMDSWEKIKKRRIPPAPLVPHSLCTRFISAFKTRKTEKTRRRITPADQNVVANLRWWSPDVRHRRQPPYIRGHHRSRWQRLGSERNFPSGLI